MSVSSFSSGRGGGFVSAPTKHVVSRKSGNDSAKETGSWISGIHFASDWRAASSAMRIQRARFASRSSAPILTIVRAETTGTIRVTPSSVAFSIVQSQREPFVTHAKSVSVRDARAEAQTGESAAKRKFFPTPSTEKRRDFPEPSKSSISSPSFGRKTFRWFAASLGSTGESEASCSEGTRRRCITVS